jgi:hypothetical protein
MGVLPDVLTLRGGDVVPMHKVPYSGGAESALFSRVPRRLFWSSVVMVAAV